MEHALNLTIEELAKELAQEKKTKYLVLVESAEKSQRIADLEAEIKALKEESQPVMIEEEQNV